MSTAAVNAQPQKGSFTSRYGNGQDDAFGKNEWGDDTCKALRDAGFKIVRFGPVGMLYVGQVNSQNVPHGQGYLFQPGGERHEGLFESGRAHGAGAYFANGKEWKGTWDHNKRIGTFNMTCPKGVKWTEKYSIEGKRTSRVKDRVEVPNPDWKEGAVDDEGNELPKTVKHLVEGDEPAVQCWQCNQFGRIRNNHAWSCRSHKGSWAYAKDYKGDGEAPGVWSCCGSENRDEHGCAFQECNFRN